MKYFSATAHFRCIFVREIFITVSNDINEYQSIKSSFHKAEVILKRQFGNDLIIFLISSYGFFKHFFFTAFCIYQVVLKNLIFCINCTK